MTEACEGSVVWLGCSQTLIGNSVPVPALEWTICQTKAKTDKTTNTAGNTNVANPFRVLSIATFTIAVRSGSVCMLYYGLQTVTQTHEAALKS